MSVYDSADDILRFYLTDYTPFFTLQSDPRVSWCAYHPRSRRAGDDALVVAIHGTDRRAEGYRDRLAQFAEENRCSVVAPLFPAGMANPLDLDSYKWVRDSGVAYDQLLLDVVDAAGEMFGLDTRRFLLHGFSGGGQFVHRFLLLHPDRVRAASIGAPGTVTLVDSQRDWWVGTRDMVERFGAGPERDELRRVAVHTVVGSQDTEVWEITMNPGDPRYVPDANRAGADRRERIASLADSLESVGATVRRDVVEGADHDGFAILEPVTVFFADVLSGQWETSR